MKSRRFEGTPVDFFNFLEERWHFRGHKNFPSMVEEVDDLARKKEVPVPFAAYFVCEENACPISTKILKTFGGSIKRIHNMRERAEKPRPDKNEAVVGALKRKGIVLPEYADEFLHYMKILAPGYKHRKVCVRAADFLIHGTYVHLYDYEFTDLFGIKSTLPSRGSAVELLEKKRPGLLGEIEGFKERQKKYQMQKVSEEMQKDPFPDDILDTYHLYGVIPRRFRYLLSGKIQKVRNVLTDLPEEAVKKVVHHRMSLWHDPKEIDKDLKFCRGEGLSKYRQGLPSMLKSRIRF